MKLILLIAILLFAAQVWANTLQPVTFSWSMNNDPGIAGYKLYQSTISGQYGAPVAILGLVNSYTMTVPILPTDQTYYFTISAFNVAGTEGVKAPEVSKLIAGIPSQVSTPSQISTPTGLILTP